MGAFRYNAPRILDRRADMFQGYKNGKKVGIVFSGGPASAANTVISSAVLSFINHNIPVIGFYSGFEFLEKFEKYNPLSLLDSVKEAISERAKKHRQNPITDPAPTYAHPPKKNLF